MKKTQRLKIFAAGSFVAAGAAVFIGQSPTFAQQEEREQHAQSDRPMSEQEAHEAFEHYMHQAGEAWRGLRNSNFDDSSRDSDLQSIQSLQEALVGVKPLGYGVHMSPRAQQEFGDDQQAYVRAIRAHVLDALAASIELERAVLDGNTEAAKAAMQQLTAAQRAGHGLFRRGPDDLGEPGSPPNGNQSNGNRSSR